MKKSKIFASLFSFIFLFNSLILPIVASDSSEVMSEEAECLGELPLTTAPSASSSSPGILSYDGTTLFDDLDDSGLHSEYLYAFSPMGLVTQPYVVHYAYNIKDSEQWFPVNTDSDLQLSFRKNYNTSLPGIPLMHSVRITTNAADGTEASMVLWFPDAPVEDFQGIYMTNQDGQPFDRSGSYSQPNNNIYITSNGTYFPYGTTLPGYFSDSAQVYFNITIPAAQVKNMYDNDTVISFYMIPVYSGMYSILEYNSGDIIRTYNAYSKIREDYYFSVYKNDPYIEFLYYQFEDGVFYNNLAPSSIRYAVSTDLDEGPLFAFKDFDPGDTIIELTGQFPKYYLDSTSNIKVYIASEQEYIDYLNSDQKVVDDNNIAKEQYDNKSQEFKDALEGFEQLPKPNYSREDVKLPENSIESIDELSGILSIIWEDKMVKEMLIISLTFVFVGYILFGKR